MLEAIGYLILVSGLLLLPYLRAVEVDYRLRRRRFGREQRRKRW